MPDDTKKPLSNIEQIQRNEEEVEEKREIVEQEIEKVEQTEQVTEKQEQPVSEKTQEIQKEGIEPGGIQPGGVSASVDPANILKEREEEIEKILAEDLEDEFTKMDPATQQEFKRKGEETAQKINNLLESAKVKVKKIIDLIRSWLIMIPGINKFFLEQETKIKTDKILKTKEK